MYKLISGISFLIRAWLCYNTIDNIPILANPIANSILLESHLAIFNFNVNK